MADKISDAKDEYTINFDAIEDFDNNLCKSLVSIVGNTTTRLRLINAAGGSIEALITLMKAEEKKLTTTRPHIAAFVFLRSAFSMARRTFRIASAAHRARSARAAASRASSNSRTQMFGTAASGIHLSYEGSHPCHLTKNSLCSPEPRSSRSRSICHSSPRGRCGA